MHFQTTAFQPPQVVAVTKPPKVDWMELGRGHPVVTTILMIISKSTSNLSSLSVLWQLKENQMKITGQLSTSYVCHLTTLTGSATKKTAQIRWVRSHTDIGLHVLSFSWLVLWYLKLCLSTLMPKFCALQCLRWTLYTVPVHCNVLGSVTCGADHYQHW